MYESAVDFNLTVKVVAVNSGISKEELFPKHKLKSLECVLLHTVTFFLKVQYMIMSDFSSGQVKFCII